MNSALKLSQLGEVWVYLSASPLFALTLTLIAYQLGLQVYERSGKSPLANPVAIAILLIVGVLIYSGISYPQYFQGAQFIHFLLGTATVSLAVPIYKGWFLLKGRLITLGFALLAGGAVSIVSALVLGRLFHLPQELLMPLYAKSVTAPIAMGVAQSIGASPTLTAVYAVITGILGSILARFVLDLLGLHQWWSRGFAVGVAAHGIGTSRAFTVSQEAGTLASIGMGLHGIAGAILIPWLIM